MTNRAQITWQGRASRAQVIGVTRAEWWFATGKAGGIGSAGDGDPKKLQ